MDVKQILTQEIIEKIESEIKEAAGQEIYIQAEMDPEAAKVTSFKVLARGNKTQVPAILSQLKTGNLVLHNHPSGNLTPSGNDIRIASRIGQQGIGFGIINNEVSSIYIVVEPASQQREQNLNQQEINDLFSPGGKMSAQLPDYEYREQQLEVVQKVIETFNSGNKCFIEAGTGTGKSFAYLIPALYWNDINQQPVVISTNTISLQEQIVNKDLVFLKKVLPFSFKSVLVKGRGNYLCLRKINNLEKKATDLFADDSNKLIQFNKILNWLERTKRGSKADLDFLVKPDMWENIVSESDLCLSVKCPFFNDCFFMQARKEIYDSDILIVNHHLLLADARLKEENNALLPEYKQLIIDEAHNFSRIATGYLGQPFNNYLLERFLQRIDDSRFSLITTLRNEAGKIDSVNNKKEVIAIIDSILKETKNLRDWQKKYFQGLFKFFEKRQEKMLRLTDEIADGFAWQKVRLSGDDFTGSLKKLGFYLEKLLNKITICLNEEMLEVFEERIIELESLNNKCQQLIRVLNYNLHLEDEDSVYWLQEENRQRKKFISQENAPLNISDLLSNLLWDRLDSLIITSATLTVNNSFEFFKRSLGTGQTDYLQVASPFNYAKQARLVVPVDIPAANSTEFLKVIMDDFIGILKSFGGATMVLFTSYRMLNYCVNKCRPALNQSGLKILAQGEHPRHYIIKNFRSNNEQIIFGTVSFWEGIDIKGDDLKYLIIMKLPFPVPSRPVAAAKKELLQKQGRNPFYHYSLPRAVIRFKQGFGRLIRSRQDKGIVVCLDKRLLEKSYGKIFLNSLPEECPISAVKIKDIIKKFDN